jgi:hypothetical protein
MCDVKVCFFVLGNSSLSDSHSHWQQIGTGSLTLFAIDATLKRDTGKINL